MKPATHMVNELFERDVRYLVPLFQRAYVWDESDQWEPLWDDVHVLLDHQRTGEDSAPGLSHFLGAIVLEQETFAPGTIPVYTVIDGQQRLTTLQLLLAASASVMREAGASDDADLFDDLVRNNPRKAKGENLFKVWPTNSNRAAFAAVIAPGGPPPNREDDPENRIDEAYQYFRARTGEWLRSEDDPDGAGSLSERALLQRITLVDLLKLVSIALEMGAPCIPPNPANSFFRRHRRCSRGNSPTEPPDRWRARGTAMGSDRRTRRARGRRSAEPLRADKGFRRGQAQLYGARTSV